jgi:plastocyanin
MTPLRFVAILAALCVLPLTAGCGGGDEAADNAQPSADFVLPDQPQTAQQTPGDGAGSGDAATSGDATEGWGDLVGQFVYVGTPPEPEKIEVTKDIEVCSLHSPVDESLVVAEDGGVTNVVVQLRVPRGQSPPTAHADYEATAEDHVVIDNEHCRFNPHVVLLRTTQTLDVKNTDPVPHNTNVQFISGFAFNPVVPAGDTVEQNVPQAEAYPGTVGCNIHPWMKGWLVVQDHPYMAVSAEDGTFEIKNLPAGEHEFQFWQEAAGNLADVSTGKGTTSRQGRLTVTVEPGTNDLGTIELTPAHFEK